LEIKEILSMRITIEALRRSKLIPQCKNCQAYGHTQKYCRKEARCVKCVGKHHMKECQKPGQSAGNRGCVVAKELQKIRNSTIRRKIENTVHETAKQQEYQTQYTHVHAGRSYPQAARSNSEEAQNITRRKHNQPDVAEDNG
jgi:hypothetical protein